MEDNQEVDFEEFMSAFDDDLDYQNEDAEKDTGVDIDVDGDEGGDQEQSDGGDTGSDQPPTENPSAQQEQKPADSETFTLKVNKEERVCTREEMIGLAQKGADYDRVKEQLTQSRQANAELQAKVDSQQEAADALEALQDFAKDAGVTVADLLDNMRLGLLKKQGLSDDVAKERLQRLKTEKENARLKSAQQPAEKPAQEDGSQRVRRELTEFRAAYPKVELTEELLGKLMPDVAAGKSLTDAYRSYEAAQKDDRIAELERQLAAEKQNKENRILSPGSQKDSGGQRTKDDFDDFFDAFEN